MQNNWPHRLFVKVLLIQVRLDIPYWSLTDKVVHIVHNSKTEDSVRKGEKHKD